MGCCQQHKSKTRVIKPKVSALSVSTADENQYLDSPIKPNSKLLLSYYASNSKMPSSFKSIFEAIFVHEEIDMDEINLNFVSFGLDGVYHFEMITSYFTHIKILKLSNIEIMNVHVKRLSHSIAQMINLEVLGVEGNRFSADGIQQLNPFKHLKKLKELYLDRNNIKSYGMKYLCENLAKLEGLEVLSLKQNLIEDEGIFTLGKIWCYLPNLKALDACENMISDIGAKYIAKNFFSLKYLDLSRNSIDLKLKFLFEANQTLQAIL
ncbi:unnamed protein product [Blepharisma stoltei]|uniref:Uncharacterized protein n=1 Tax=Blepharisma stoltei TaxID=1481888 RepID=A0AAU9K2M8_9CILI|nr:unnamed protein product [Blepharisma stoltei]